MHNGKKEDNEKNEKKPGKVSFFEAFKKKEINEDEIEDLEKGDFLALMLAMASYMIPLAIVIVLFFALLAWLFIN